MIFLHTYESNFNLDYNDENQSSESALKPKKKCSPFNDKKLSPLLAPGKNRPPPSAFRLAENGKKRPIHGKSAQGVTEP